MGSNRITTFLFLSLLVIFAFQNCSTYHQGATQVALSTDSSLNSDEESFKLHLPAMTLQVSALEHSLSVAGACEVPFGQRHLIEMEIVPVQGNSLGLNALAPIALKESSQCPVGAQADASCFKWTEAICEHGRYYAQIPILTVLRNQMKGANILTSVAFRWKAEIVKIDEKEGLIRDSKWKVEAPLAIFPYP